MRMVHRDHGTCQCGEWQVDEFVALGWQVDGQEESFDDPVVLVDDQQMTELSSVGVESLEDAVDNRALPHLRDAGIETMEDLVEYARDFRDVLIDVPYITERTLKKLGL